MAPQPEAGTPRGLPVLREMGDWFRELGNVLTLGALERRSMEADARSPPPAPPRRHEQPDTKPPPPTSILDKQPQVVVGVLLKYVRLGTGWRTRLFVLDGGVLQYYKVQGPTAVNVARLLDALRQQGELYLIGAEVSMLEAQDRRQVSSPLGSVSGRTGSTLAAAAPSTARRLPHPQGEVHLQVATVRESGADARKLYINTGTQVIALRAETADDRWVWSEALRGAKGAWQGVTPAEAGALRRNHSGRVCAADDAFLSALERVTARLAAAGLDAGTQAYVEDQLVQAHQQYHELAVGEENKRRVLLDMIYALENDKRQLETALVVESAPGRLGVDGRRGGMLGAAAPAARGAEGGAGGAGGEEEGEEDEEGSAAGGDEARQMSFALGSSEASDDEFFECETASAGSSRASLVSSSSPQRGGAPPPALSDPDWVAAEGPAPTRRDRLPPPAQRERSVSLWGLIKDMVGRDLTRICLPVYFNEPLSALQKSAEDLEYSELLDEAAALPPRSAARLLRVAAFAVAGYSGTVGRTAKPFNPLLGETYELVCVEKGVRFVAEKVVHHPTIIAAHAEGRGWALDGDADVKSKFWGRSIELHPEGVLRVTFHDSDAYCWSKVTTSINNLILGKIYVDHGGVMRVRCLSGAGGCGLAARLRFKESGMFERDPRQVRGYLEEGGRRLDRPLIHGHWDDALAADWGPVGGTELLWRKAAPPPEPTRYNLTRWAIQLNELTPGLVERVAPTDCRLRPDQAALEQGQYDQANVEKQRLEHKQRAARAAADRGDPIEPRWFTAHGDAHQGEEPHYRYRGGYWEERAAGAFTGCRDIFGQDVAPSPPSGRALLPTAP